MKDLIYLVAVSSAMCGLIALYAHLVGLSQRAAFNGPQQAKDLAQQENPEKTLSAIKLSKDKQVALANFSDGTASLLYSLGRKWVTHALEANSIKNVKIKKNGNVHITLPDFTAPSLTINSENSAAVQSWLVVLEPFICTSAILANMPTT